MLRAKGIEVVEIPRKKMDDQWISASKVRKYLERGELGKALELLPKTTADTI